MNKNATGATRATGATGATGEAEVVARSAARTPLPHAPGARMTVVYTNSLKLKTGSKLVVNDVWGAMGAGTLSLARVPGPKGPQNL